MCSISSEPSSAVWKEVCQISDDCFTVPAGYRRLNQLGGRGMIDEEEELLQLAIRQSLLEQSGGGGKVGATMYVHINVPFITSSLHHLIGAVEFD